MTDIKINNIQKMLDVNSSTMQDNMSVAFAANRTSRNFVEKIEDGVAKSLAKFSNVKTAAMCNSFQVDGFHLSYDEARNVTTFGVDLTFDLFEASVDAPLFDGSVSAGSTLRKSTPFNISIQGNKVNLFETNKGFAKTVVFALLHGLVVPLSIFSAKHDWDQYTFSILQNMRDAATKYREVEGFTLDNNAWIDAIVSQDHRELAHHLAYYAWSDRFNMYRNLSTGGSEYLPHVEDLKAVFNPYCYVRKPAAVAAYARSADHTVPDTLPEGTDALVSLSWGKESLLSVTLAQKVYGVENIRFGVIKHDLGEYKYQDSYDKFITGSPLDGAQHTAVAINYLKLLQDLIPTICGCGRFCAPTNALHHIYALAHMLNNWETTSVVFMGDEAERTVDNLVMKHIDDIGRPYTPVVSKTEVEHSQVENLGTYQAIGVEHTFDFHQSEHMAQALNYYLRTVLGVDKRLSSMVYTVNELQIQFLLAKLNPALFDYQVSCWFADDPEKHGGSKWCCSCKKCWRLFHLMRCLGLEPEKRGLTTNISMAQIKEQLPQMLAGGKIFAVDSEQGNISKTLVENNYIAMFDDYIRDEEAILELGTVHVPLLTRPHNQAILDIISEPLQEISKALVENRVAFDTL
ncbi:hypothetical protein [Ewingella americana]|uniref:Uncharacterized protein n=1 Tax=Ewingella americana TaxID=41202 RepID=A0A502GCU8_9GAMM|nr:hypothetical protein [Ewingella americana]TPG60097.1 hypothetical protein EAH77_16140 [Ewingella americana]